jgi:oligopeptidase A
MFETFNAENLADRPEKLKALLADHETQLEKLLAQKPYRYNTLVRPIQKMKDAIERFFTPVAILQYTKNSDETQAAYSAMLPLLSEHETRFSQDERLYGAFKTILNEQPDLLPAQRKVLTDLVQEFELEGAGAKAVVKDRIKAINLRLSDLDNQFSQNLLDATKAYELILTDEADVAGIPKSDLEAMEVEPGRWRFSLLPHSFQAYMTYGPNRTHREALYRAFTTRAPENGALIEEILALRHEKATLLGFKNYAELSLATKMAPGVAAVERFILDLIEKSRPQAEGELEQLQRFANENGFEGDLQSYDTGFWAKKLEVAKYDLDEEAYRPYFEAESVTGGLFDFLNRLFGVRFEPVNAPAWDEGVRVFDLKKEGRTFARFYADLFAREEKRGGAWMDSWQARMKDEADRLSLPSAYIACNFPPPKGGKPSLLRHDDVVTLFHEMGHAIHHLFSEVDEYFVSGISGVEWDAVEFPSQWLENFAYEPAVLRLFARHHESGEVLPEAMIDRLIAAKNFLSASALLRQCEFSLFDLRIHTGPHDEGAVQRELDRVREKTALIKPPGYNRFQNGFGHIFSGGYAAGYYSYKWAEVLSADAFNAFIQRGIFEAETARRFAGEVLTIGGSRPAAESFKAFMGREPDSDALLKLNGIEAA